MRRLWYVWFPYAASTIANLPPAMLALVKASGPLGLATFLPPEDRRVHIEEPTPTPDGFIPHLPLVDDWHDGKFALRDVLKEAHTTNIRDWSLMLLQRYRYVIGMLRCFIPPPSLQC